MDASEVVAPHKVVPVVVLEDKTKALKLTELFLSAGLNCIEVTLRTENALACIEAIARELPEVTLGAGSVITPNQLSAANDSGIDFAVSPGVSTELLEAATTTPLIPGAATASEVMNLKSAGYQTVKFFPAELLGGIEFIRALCAPITGVQFFPTGGIRETNFQQYLEFERIICVGGTWLAPTNDILSGRWQEIESRCKSLQRVLSGKPSES